MKTQRTRAGITAIHTVVLMFTFLFLATNAYAKKQDSGDASRKDNAEKVVGDDGIIDIYAVERGFHVGVEVGANYVLNLGSGPALNPNWSSVGQRFGVRLGYDVLNNLTLGVFTLAQFHRLDVDLSNTMAGRVTGDISHFAPGVYGSFAFVTKHRFFSYVRGGIGLDFWVPSDRLVSADDGQSEYPLLIANESIAASLLAEVALGVEYYTKLRHISLGVELGFQANIRPELFGLFVTFPVKYTF